MVVGSWCLVISFWPGELVDVSVPTTSEGVNWARNEAKRKHTLHNLVHHWCALESYIHYKALRHPLSLEERCAPVGTGYNDYYSRLRSTSPCPGHRRPTYRLPPFPSPLRAARRGRVGTKSSSFVSPYQLSLDGGPLHG